MEANNSKAVKQDEEHDDSSPIPIQSGIAVPSTSPTALTAELSTSQPRQKSSQLTEEEFDEPDCKVKIDDFDWEALELRYHNMIKERGKVEEDLYAEFDGLMKV
jgi:hypothetical protein